MSLESELRAASEDLAFGDEAAAEVVLRFVQFMNGEEHVQSASSMILNLGKALVEFEDAQDPEPDVNGN
jgi:hypothetical protein